MNLLRRLHKSFLFTSKSFYLQVNWIKLEVVI